MILLSKGHSTEARKNNVAVNRIVYAITFLIWSIAANAQVANNTITARSNLQVDAWPTYSTTDQSTVEWACVNKKLTSKCLIYHNDQWFTFIPTKSQAFFLNVSQQKCQKKFGVQIVVLEGNPCETETYKLLHCESFTDQSDTFIRLDSLMPDKQYLINVDGFLGDICGFEIQIATKPKGLPLKEVSMDTLQLITLLNKNLVTLQWKIERSLLDSIHHFEVYKNSAADVRKLKLIDVLVRYNTIREPLQQYTVVDTLVTPGTYTYSIIGVTASETNRLLLDQQKIIIDAERSKSKRMIAKVPLTYSKKADIDFFVIDPLTDQVIMKRTCVQCKDELIDIDLTEEVETGMTRFWVRTQHAKTKETVQHIFYVKNGELIHK
jgi:hypothetical protein